MPRRPSISRNPAAMGAPMTWESAVLVATMASAGPVSSAEWNTVMCTHMPGKVPASTMPRISLCKSACSQRLRTPGIASAQCNTRACIYMPGKVPASTMLRISLCSAGGHSFSHRVAFSHQVSP